MNSKSEVTVTSTSKSSKCDQSNKAITSCLDIEDLQFDESDDEHVTWPGHEEQDQDFLLHESQLLSELDSPSLPCMISNAQVSSIQFGDTISSDRTESANPDAEFGDLCKQVALSVNNKKSTVKNSVP